MGLPKAKEKFMNLDQSYNDINFTYYAPSMGGLDLAIGYAPSSAAPNATTERTRRTARSTRAAA